MELQEYRAEFDAIDRELTALFKRRMELAARLAAYKRAQGLPVLDERREAEKLAAVREALPEELRDDGAALFQTLFALSRACQERVMEAVTPREGT